MSIVISIDSGLDFHEAEWRDLEGRCNGHVFQSFDWVNAWRHTAHAAKAIVPVILIARLSESGRMMMLWPLALRNSPIGLRSICKLGGIHADYGGPIYDRQSLGNHRREFAGLLVSTLREARIDYVDLEGVPKDDCEWLGLDRFSIGPGEQASRIVFPSDPSAFFSSLSKKLIADIRRQERRLSELGNLEIVIGATGQRARDITEAMLQQKAERYIATGAANQFLMGGNRDFYRTATERFASSSGMIHVSAILLNGKVIAAHWGAKYGSTFYYLMPSYDSSDVGKYSPGKILLDKLIRNMASYGVRVFDLTIGDEPYKNIWSNETIHLLRLNIAPRALGNIGIFLNKAFLRTYYALRAIRVVRDLKRNAFRGGNRLAGWIRGSK